MNSMKKLTAASILALAGLATGASAASIGVTETQAQTSEGQNFLFSFAGLAASDGNGGTLVISARGDYEEVAPLGGEAMSVDAEGQFSVAQLGGFDGNNTGVGLGGPFDSFEQFSAFTDVAFTRTFNLSGTILDALLADGTINVAIDLTDGVDIFDSNSAVTVSVNYDTVDTPTVPLPAGMPLLLAGLGGLAMMRRRKT